MQECGFCRINRNAVRIRIDFGFIRMNNKQLVNVKCDICKSDDFKQLMRVDHNCLPCHVAICRTCGLAMLNPRWSKNEYEDFYIKEYDEYYRGKPSKSLFEYEISHKGIPFMERVSPYLKQENIEVFDIGCGYCWSYQVLSKKYKANIDVIESSLQCLEELAKIDNIKVISSNIGGKWHETDKKYDLIIIRHVLEHMWDPQNFLTRLNKILKDDGIIYIAVPNSMMWNKNKIISEIRNVHLYYFNIWTLSKICALSGLYMDSFGETTEIWSVLKKGTKSNVREIKYSEQLASLKKLRKQRRITFLRKSFSNPKWFLKLVNQRLLQTKNIK